MMKVNRGFSPMEAIAEPRRQQAMPKCAHHGAMPPVGWTVVDMKADWRRVFPLDCGCFQPAAITSPSDHEAPGHGIEGLQLMRAAGGFHRGGDARLVALGDRNLEAQLPE